MSISYQRMRISCMQLSVLYGYDADSYHLPEKEYRAHEELTEESDSVRGLISFGVRALKGTDQAEGSGGRNALARRRSGAQEALEFAFANSFPNSTKITRGGGRTISADSILDPLFLPLSLG